MVLLSVFLLFFFFWFLWGFSLFGFITLCHPPKTELSTLFLIFASKIDEEPDFKYKYLDTIFNNAGTSTK